MPQLVQVQHLVTFSSDQQRFTRCAVARPGLHLPEEQARGIDAEHNCGDGNSGFVAHRACHRQCYPVTVMTEIIEERQIARDRAESKCRFMFSRERTDGGGRNSKLTLRVVQGNTLVIVVRTKQIEILANIAFGGAAHAGWLGKVLADPARKRGTGRNASRVTQPFPPPGR